MNVTANRLAALFAAGLMALYSPLLSAFNQPDSLLGIPILPLYLFAVWAGVVLASWLITRKDEP